MSFTNKSNKYKKSGPAIGMWQLGIETLTGKKFLCIKDYYNITEGNIYTVVSRVYNPKSFKELIRVRPIGKEEIELQPWEIDRETFNECLTNDIQKIREFNLNKILKK